MTCEAAHAGTGRALDSEVPHPEPLMAKRTVASEDYPSDLMDGVCWSFRNIAKFRSRKKFNEEVRRYHEGCESEQGWEPDAVVLRVPRVRVRAELAWLDRDPVVELTADNGAAFTAGELLFKIHNAFVALIRDSDYV